MADFIPPGDDARKTWCTTLRNKIAALGATLGLTPAQITAIQDKSDAIIGRIDEKAAKKNEWRASIAAAETGNAADFTDLRQIIAGIRTLATYTPAIGEELGFIGPDDTFDPSTYKAELRGLVLSAPSQVTVSFGKAKGKIDGVNIYSRVQGTAEWIFKARDTQSPYIDTTPLQEAGKPEIREYRLRAVIDDVEIGDYSDTQQITVS